MKNKNLLIFVLLSALIIFAFSNNDIKHYIGNIVITDTTISGIKGNMKTSYLIADSILSNRQISGEHIYGQSLIFNPLGTMYIYNDGSDIYTGTTNTGIIRFFSGIQEDCVIDSLNGVYSKHFISLASTNLTATTPPDKTVKIYIKDNLLIFRYYKSSTEYFYYIDLTSTSNQQFTFSPTEP